MDSFFSKILTLDPFSCDPALGKYYLRIGMFRVGIPQNTFTIASVKRAQYLKVGGKQFNDPKDIYALTSHK